MHLKKLRIINWYDFSLRSFDLLMLKTHHLELQDTEIENFKKWRDWRCRKPNIEGQKSKVRSDLWDTTRSSGPIVIENHWMPTRWCSKGAQTRVSLWAINICTPNPWFWFIYILSCKYLYIVYWRPYNTINRVPKLHFEVVECLVKCKKESQPQIVMCGYNSEVGATHTPYYPSFNQSFIHIVDPNGQFIFHRLFTYYRYLGVASLLRLSLPFAYKPGTQYKSNWILILNY